MDHKQNTQKGFTLVELLVVIAIIAVLAGVLLVTINPNALIQKSRDSKRLQDIDSLVKAINLSLADSEITLAATAAGCANCSSSTGTQAVDGTNGYVKFTIPAGKQGLVKFIATLPVDPLNTGTNVYTFASTTTNFEVDAVLEHPDNLTKMSLDGGDNANVYEAGTSLTILH